VPQSNIKWSLGTLVEELWEGLQALKEIGTLQEDQQSQLTWTTRGSQKLNHQPKSIHRLDLGLLAHMEQICSLVFMWISQQLEQGLSLNLLPACGSCSLN
ncbi:mCG1046215, partial [Mus musculus]